MTTTMEFRVTPIFGELNNSYFENKHRGVSIKRSEAGFGGSIFQAELGSFHRNKGLNCTIKHMEGS